MLITLTLIGLMAGALLLWRRAARRVPAPLALPAPVAAATPPRAELVRTVRVYFIKPSRYDDRGRVATSGRASFRTTP